MSAYFVIENPRNMKTRLTLDDIFKVVDLARHFVNIVQSRNLDEPPDVVRI
jgi:hypothetical protein